MTGFDLACLIAAFLLFLVVLGLLGDSIDHMDARARSRR